MTPRIIIDTREQAPLIPVIWRGRAWVELPYVRAALKAGDYSVEGAEHLIAIERKSIGDLAGTLYGSATDASGERQGHLERFRRELERLAPFARKWWLIEGSPDDFEMHILHRLKRVHPVNAQSLVASIACDYNIPLIWAGNRQRAAHFLGVTLGRIIDQMSDKKAVTKARNRDLDLPWLGKCLPWDEYEEATEAQ